MEIIELIKTVALLCQINVASSGVASDARLSSEEAQKNCHKYYTKCVFDSTRVPTAWDMGKQLQKCIKDR